MRFPIYQVDAFASRVFTGNPAAVVPLERWLDDATLQGIALENNLSETAFLVKEDAGWRIRWFTPVCEVDLCGHATLASGHVVFAHLEPTRSDVTFASRSGPLTVTRDGELLRLDFPSRPPEPYEAPLGLIEALGRAPKEVLRARDVLALYDTEADVRALAPDFGRMAKFDAFAVMATAKGSGCDFVSRFFAPRSGIDEDPVTGSAHCTLVPFWARRLGKQRLHALQVSARGGELFCEDRGPRVHISGRAVEYLQGTIAT